MNGDDMPRIMNTVLLVLLTSFAPATASEVRTVIIVGIDGLSSRGLDEGITPHINRLLEEGAHTFHARGVFPTSLPPTGHR
jgi:hypothetical protein